MSKAWEPSSSIADVRTVWIPASAILVDTVALRFMKHKVNPASTVPSSYTPQIHLLKFKARSIETVKRLLNYYPRVCTEQSKHTKTKNQFQTANTIRNFLVIRKQEISSSVDNHLLKDLTSAIMYVIVIAVPVRQLL